MGKIRFTTKLTEKLARPFVRRGTYAEKDRTGFRNKLLEE